jgi:hypothetical protein
MNPLFKMSSGASHHSNNA